MQEAKATAAKDAESEICPLYGGSVAARRAQRRDYEKPVATSTIAEAQSSASAVTITLRAIDQSLFTLPRVPRQTLVRQLLDMWFERFWCRSVRIYRLSDNTIAPDDSTAGDLISAHGGSGHVTVVPTEDPCYSLLAVHDDTRRLQRQQQQSLHERKFNALHCDDGPKWLNSAATVPRFDESSPGSMTHFQLGCPLSASRSPRSSPRVFRFV